MLLLIIVLKRIVRLFIIAVVEAVVRVVRVAEDAAAAEEEAQIKKKKEEEKSGEAAKHRESRGITSLWQRVVEGDSVPLSSSETGVATFHGWFRTSNGQADGSNLLLNTA